jgi:type IV pilus assembly protein PilF
MLVMNSKFLLPKVLWLVGLCLMLQACVTTTDSALSGKADPEIAVERFVALGLEYIKRGELHLARKRLNRALEISPEDASANAALGLVYHQEGELAAAENFFKKSLESDPAYTRGRSYYGAFLYSVDRVDDAFEQFELASKDTTYEGRSQIFSNIALCQLKLGNTQKAIDAYTTTLRLDRNNGRALSGVTELLIQEENYEQAKHYYNRLVRLIRERGMQHSAQSLWLGIRIANYYQSYQRLNTLAGLLNQMYPDTEENRLSNVMLKNVSLSGGMSK